MTKLTTTDHSPDSSAISLEQLEQWMAIESVEKLASRVSHDLIQPLSEIVNHVWFCRELVGRSPAMSEAHQSLTSIEDQAMRAAEMIRAVRQIVCSREHDHAVVHSASDTIS